MKRPAHITLVNSVETSALDIADRGLAYGDGLFETMRVHQGEVPLLSWHLQRFLRGVEVLGLGDEDRLKRDFLHNLQTTLKKIQDNACHEASVIKMMITRGNGGQGYLPPEDANCQFITQVFNLPSYPANYRNDGITIRECQYRLGFQPQLVGIKHLNRLDQVLASQELLGEPEGLILDYDGNVIEGTKSNVLLFKGNQIFTPKLTGCGVNGVLRDELLNPSYAFSADIILNDIHVSELDEYDGLAMINSVFGVWLVNTLILQSGKKINFKRPANYEIIQKYLAQNYSY